MKYYLSMTSCLPGSQQQISCSLTGTTSLTFLDGPNFQWPIFDSSAGITCEDLELGPDAQFCWFDCRTDRAPLDSILVK